MDSDKLVLAALTSAMTKKGAVPLTLGEWKTLWRDLTRLRVAPGMLLGRSARNLTSLLELSLPEAERLGRLLDRAEALELDLLRWESRGVFSLTLADEWYPKTLRSKLGEDCPPIFYYSGNIRLLSRPAAGYVGVRDMTPQDARFTLQAVQKTVERGFCVVSGGARGVDSTAQSAALEWGEGVVSFLCDAVSRHLGPRESRLTRDGQTLLISLVEPDGEFTPQGARQRNRYIYAHSRGTVVIHAKLGEGGTWGGAKEALAWGLCPVLCWDEPDYPGNQALIHSGAYSVSESWNGDLAAFPAPCAPVDQTSLFNGEEPWDLDDPRWEEFYREEAEEHLREQQRQAWDEAYISLL